MTGKESGKHGRCPIQNDQLGGTCARGNTRDRLRTRNSARLRVGARVSPPNSTVPATRSPSSMGVRKTFLSAAVTARDTFIPGEAIVT